MRYVARVLVLLWSGLWVYFGVASGIGEGLNVGGVILHTLAPGGLFAVLVAVTWRWEHVGGWILVVESLAVFVAYMVFVRFPFLVRLSTAALLSLPSLIAGWLFLASWRWRTAGRGEPPGGRGAMGILGRLYAPADGVAPAAGGVLLLLTVLAMLWMIGGSLWYSSPWGPEKWDLSLWLALVGINLAFLGLLAAVLVWQARVCLGRPGEPRS